MLLSRILRNCSSVMVAIGPMCTFVAALQTRMSILPKASRALAVRFTRSSFEEIFAATAIAVPGPCAAFIASATAWHGSSLREEITTLAPCSARRSATARPMPRDEPVMTATWPETSKSDIRQHPRESLEHYDTARVTTRGQISEGFRGGIDRVRTSDELVELELVRLVEVEYPPEIPLGVGGAEIGPGQGPFLEREAHGRDRRAVFRARHANHHCRASLAQHSVGLGDRLAAPDALEAVIGTAARESLDGFNQLCLLARVDEIGGAELA